MAVASDKPAAPPLRGMMPILPTAIQESGELDEASERRLVQYCLQCGAVAIGHLGVASEFHKISNDDRARLIDIVVDEVDGRVPVFIGVTAPATRSAAHNARQAEALGADMLMLGMPYITVPSKAELFDYYRAVAESTSLPIIVQDTPLSDPILDVDLICRLHDEIPHIMYVKAEGKDFLTKTHALLERRGGRLGVIGGAGGKHMIHLLRLGVTAFMTGTEALDVHNAVVRAFLAGDEDQAARTYFERLLPYYMFYEESSSELLKEILKRRGIIDCAKVIPPAGVQKMSAVRWREFEWLLQRCGLTSRWPDIH